MVRAGPGPELCRHPAGRAGAGGGTAQQRGRLLPWVSVAGGDRAALQVPGRASAASESKTAAF